MSTVLFVVFSVALLAIAYVACTLRLRKKTKELEEQACEVRKLPNGEVLIKTEAGLYFHAIDDNGVPVLISKDEGERLWSLAD